MEYQVFKNEGQNYFTVVLSGQFDPYDLEKCYLELIHHPHWQVGGDILWDVRQCTSDHLDSPDIRAIAMILNKYREQRGRGRAAWLVSRDMDFGMSRMFEMMNENTVVFQFRVFRNQEEAEQYLLS